MWRAAGQLRACAYEPHEGHMACTFQGTCSSTSTPDTWRKKELPMSVSGLISTWVKYTKTCLQKQRKVRLICMSSWDCHTTVFSFACPPNPPPFSPPPPSSLLSLSCLQFLPFPFVLFCLFTDTGPCYVTLASFECTVGLPAQSLRTWAWWHKFTIPALRHGEGLRTRSLRSLSTTHQAWCVHRGYRRPCLKTNNHNKQTSHKQQPAPDFLS